MTKAQKPDANALTAASECSETGRKAIGRAALRPEMNALVVVNAFKKEAMGDDADVGLMMADLKGCIQAVKAGDLSHLEAMLLAQATALQAMFTSFAVKASRQEHLGRHQIFMTMAFKAQAQSRATLQTLGDLKNPRQPTFVKQANIAHGHQQVNNGPMAHAGAGKKQSEPNKLLEVDNGNVLDTRAQAAPSRNDPTLEAVEKVHRTKNARRKKPSSP
jgi:hypothetical protein